MVEPGPVEAPSTRKLSKRLLAIIVAIIVAAAGVAAGYFLFFAAGPPSLAPVFRANVNLLTVSVDASVAEPKGLIQSYEWDWGDGSAAGTGQTATHTYSQGGEYTITLNVTDSLGRRASSRQEVSVDPDSTIYTRLWDFCQPTFRNYWSLREIQYGDKIIRNEPPAVNEYPWGFSDREVRRKDTSLYCSNRFASHGVNVPSYSMAEPVFFPYVARFDSKPLTKGPADNTTDPLTALESEDGVSLVVGPGKTLWIDTFDTGGRQTGRVWSATIEARYSTDPGIRTGPCTRLQGSQVIDNSSNTCIRWRPEGLSTNESVALRLRATGGQTTTVFDWITLSPTRISSWDPLDTLNVTLNNPSGTASVYIDYLRIAVFYDIPLPETAEGRVTLNWFMTYATAETQAEWTALGYFDTSGQDDGFITDLRGTLTMDYDTSRRVFGVTGDPGEWWARVNAVELGYAQTRTSGIEAAWSNWFEWNGNIKYDIFNGFEWYFQIFIFELNGTVLQQGGTNQTVVDFGIVAWGNEVLLSRWFYWGGASYVNEPGADGSYNTGDDTPSTPRGWYRQEVGWWEDAFFNATIDTSLDFDFQAILGYQTYAAADPGPDGIWKTSDDEAIWGWEPNLIDYIYNASTNPRGEMAWYVNQDLTYVHNTPGAFVYGEEFLWDNTFARWDLGPGETIAMELPRTPLIWFDPVRSFYDEAAGTPVYTTFFASLTLKRTEPADIGLWDDSAKTFSMAGPVTMPTDGNPPLRGLPTITWKPAG